LVKGQVELSQLEGRLKSAPIEGWIKSPWKKFLSSQVGTTV